MQTQIMRVFDVSIGTPTGRDTLRVVAKSSMAAFQWVLRQRDDQESVALRSLVVKPAKL